MKRVYPVEEIRRFIMIGAAKWGAPSPEDVAQTVLVRACASGTIREPRPKKYWVLAGKHQAMRPKMADTREVPLLLAETFGSRALSFPGSDTHCARLSLEMQAPEEWALARAYSEDPTTYKPVRERVRAFHARETLRRILNGEAMA